MYRWPSQLTFYYDETSTSLSLHIIVMCPNEPVVHSIKSGNCTSLLKNIGIVPLVWCKLIYWDWFSPEHKARGESVPMQVPCPTIVSTFLTPGNDSGVAPLGSIFEWTREWEPPLSNNTVINLFDSLCWMFCAIINTLGAMSVLLFFFSLGAGTPTPGCASLPSKVAGFATWRCKDKGNNAKLRGQSSDCAQRHQSDYHCP